MDPLRDQFVKTEAGTAARTRDTEKTNKYTILAMNNNPRLLYPASQEATGRMSKGFRLCEKHHNTEAFERTAPRRTWASASYRQYYLQRLAIVFWCGSLAMHKRCASVNTYRAHNTSRLRPPPPLSP